MPFDGRDQITEPSSDDSDRHASTELLLDEGIAASMNAVAVNMNPCLLLTRRYPGHSLAGLAQFSNLIWQQ